MFSLLGPDDVGRQMALAEPAPGEAEFPDEAGVEDDEYDERTEEDEEAVEDVLVEDVVDEVALEVRLNGARWLHRRHVPPATRGRRRRRRRIPDLV